MTRTSSRLRSSWQALVLALGPLALGGCQKPPPLVTVVSAAADLPAGTVLERHHLGRTDVPAEAASPALVRPLALEPLLGQTLKQPLPRGTLLRTAYLGPKATPLADEVQGKGRAVTAYLSGAEFVQVGDRVDLSHSIRDPASGEYVVLTTHQNLPVLRLPGGPPGPPVGGVPTRPVTVLVPSAEEGEILVQAARGGGVHLTVRNPTDKEIAPERQKTNAQTLLTGERATALRELREKLTRPPATPPVKPGREP